MQLECNACPFRMSLEPDERRPPWCPRCGGNLKEPAPVKAIVAAETAAAPTAVAEFPTAGSAQSKGSAGEAPNPTDFVLPVDEEGGPAGQVFRGSLLRQAAAWACAVVCLGIALAAASQLPHPRKGQETGIYGCLGLFGLGTLVALYVCFRLAGQKYAVFADRLVEWQCFRPRSFRWDQVREIYQDAHPAWTTYQVLTSVGHEFTIRGEVANHKRLGELISRRITARLLPAALAELEAGRDVRLGPLRVTAAGAVIDGQLEPWHRIGIPTLARNRLPKRGSMLISNMLHARIGGSLVELGEIPNYGLFEALACHFSLAASGATATR